MGSRWAPLLVLLALVLSSGSAATGTLEPLQCPYQNEEAPHKPQPPITTCSSYADNACCDHRDTNDLIRWLYVSQKRGGQDGTNGECLSLLHIMRCGLLCSPAQADFVEKTNPMQSSSKLKLAASPQMPYTYRLCSSFCDRLYAACSDEGMREVEEAEAGPTWDAAMTWDSEHSSTAAEEFCKSMAPSDVEIVVVEDIPTKSGDGHKHLCFNGRPTTASAKTSFAYGQGLTADFAGRWSFFIQAVDAQGEEVRDGGDHFMARVQQIPEGVSIDVEQTDMSNGLYSVSFVLSDPGRYKISVLLEGQHVSNSPTYTTIVDHNKCLVPKTNRRAQRPEPQLKRCKWYNEKACCTADKDRSVDQWMAKAINPLFKHKPNCQALFEDLWCGYECSPHRPHFLDPYDTINEEQGMRICSSFCKSLYGECKDTPIMGLTIRAVYARHQDFCMANTPNNFLRVTVTDTHCFNGTKAELSPERTYVYGRGTSGVAPAGQQMPVHVQAIDIHGQPMTTGGEQFTMHVDGPDVDKSAIVDHKNGTYTLLYRVSRAALYNISVYHQGILLDQSPFTVLGRAGPTDPLASLVQGPGLYLAMAGLPATFTVQARDEFGNARANEDDVVHAYFSGPLNVIVDVLHQVRDAPLQQSVQRVFHSLSPVQGEGLYEARYATNLAGEYMLRVTVNGFQVPGSPFLVRVEAEEETFAAKCEIRGAAASRGISRAVNTFEIIAKDYYGNIRGEGGDLFRVHFQDEFGDRVGEADVRDLRDGFHEVTYRLNTAGRYMMYIEMLEPSMRDETWSPVAVGPVDVASQPAVVVSSQPKPGSATRLGHNTPTRSSRPKL